MGMNDISANDIISNMGANNLTKVLKIFSEEKYSKKIAIEIVKKDKKDN